MLDADRDISMVEMTWTSKEDACKTFLDTSRQDEDPTTAVLNDGKSFQDIRIFHLFVSTSKQHI